MPRSRPARLTSALLGLALAAGAAGFVAQQRADTAAAQRAELAAESTTLTQQVSQLRHTVAAPAHDAQQDTAALRVLVAEAITGSERDPAAVAADVARVADRLRTHAQRLESAVDSPLPARPDALPLDRTQPLFARLEPLGEQTLGLAEQLRASADQVERLGTAATALQAAAADYAATTEDLPDGEDPDVHATAWRNESTRLADYREAVDAAAGVDGLDGLVAAHEGLLDALDTFAAEALAELEAGDIEGYNARVAAGVDEAAVTDWRDGLATGADTALDAPAIAHLDRARGLALGLVKELDNVRRSSHLAVEG